MRYPAHMNVSSRVLGVVVGSLIASAVAIGACSSDEPASTTTSSSGSGGVGTSSGVGSTSSSGALPAPDASAVTCTGGDEAALQACVSKARYVADVGFFGGALRTPGSAHWRASADYCESVLRAEGFQVEVDEYSTGRNIVGTLTGSARPNEHVVLGAHYDHIANCNGADDNATGVAGVLELARVLSDAPRQRSLVVACWDEEERGHLGSESWAKKAKGAGKSIAQYINFDMIGYASAAPNSQQMPAEYENIYREQYSALRADQFRGDFLWTFYDKRSQPFARTWLARGEALGRRSTGVQIPSALLGMSSLQSSDHAAFWGQDWPAAHIGDTGDLRNPNYHCKNGTADTVATLDHDYAYDVIRATAAATLVMLGANEPAIDTTPNVTTCAQFCARAGSFDAQTKECMVSVFAALGVQPPASCGAVTNPATCNTCASDLGINALQCEGLADLCVR